LYPRAWLPAFTQDRGLTALGASVAGADALGWHRYAATLLWETSQRQLLGTAEYIFVGSHGLALSRELNARAWTAGDERTTVYDRRTRAQWLSLLPFNRLQQRLNFGVGAALDRVERVDLLKPEPSTSRPREERVLALLADISTLDSDWYSSGPQRGWRASLLYETYKPVAPAARVGTVSYDGALLRADLRAMLPLGRQVLALRWSEVLAQGRTEPFQLGGATDTQLQIGYALNQRTLSLRGYAGNDAVLRGRNARVLSVEWRAPLADIDWHGMVPPVGIKRLSGTLFGEAGGAWNSGRSVNASPPSLRRAVGAELLAETKLFYALALNLRLGVARALDAPQGTRVYLTLGRAY